MFVCHPENDSDKLDPETAHSEGLGTRFYRRQPGPSFQFPEMLSVPGEAIYRGNVRFLLYVNHKGVQFVTPFSKFTMTMYYDFWRILLEDFSTYMSPPLAILVAWSIWLQSISISPLDSFVQVFLGNFSSTPTSCEEGYIFLDCNQMPIFLMLDQRWHVSAFYKSCKPNRHVVMFKIACRH